MLVFLVVTATYLALLLKKIPLLCFEVDYNIVDIILLYHDSYLIAKKSIYNIVSVTNSKLLKKTAGRFSSLQFSKDKTSIFY